MNKVNFISVYFFPVEELRIMRNGISSVQNFQGYCFCCSVSGLISAACATSLPVYD